MRTTATDGEMGKMLAGTRATVLKDTAKDLADQIASMLVPVTDADRALKLRIAASLAQVIDDLATVEREGRQA